MLGDPDAEVRGLEPADAEQIATLLSVLTGNAEQRHAGWAKAVARGMFSFGAAKLPVFVAKGIGSWKHDALATEREHDAGDECFEYNPSFLTSNWKLFHDALQKHKYSIVSEVLPPYGILTA